MGTGKKIYLGDLTLRDRAFHLHQATRPRSSLVGRISLNARLPSELPFAVSSNLSICTPPPQETEKEKKKSATSGNKYPLIPQWHEKKNWHLNVTQGQFAPSSHDVGLLINLTRQQTQKSPCPAATPHEQIMISFSRVVQRTRELDFHISVHK